MKKLIQTITLTLLISIVPQAKSHAIVGIATGNAPMALAGLASPALGYVGVFVGSEIGICREFACLNIFGIGILAGVVLLDEEQSSVSFNEISYDKAAELGISKTDLEIYNSEVEEVNAVFEEVSANLNSKSTVEDSRELWKDFSEYLSPETYEVMKKLR